MSETLPLNPAQKWLLAGGASPFRSLTQVSISFGERIDAARLQSTWTEIFRIHSALRVKFGAGEQMHQYVSDLKELPWANLDWSEIPPAEVGEKWQDLLKTDREKPLSENDSVLTRFHFITLPGGSGHLLWTFSEMVADEESVPLLVRELLLRYDGTDFSEAEEDSAWRQFAEWNENAGSLKETVNQALRDESYGVSISSGMNAQDATPWEQTHLLNPALIAEIQNCEENLHVPANTIFEAAWALVVARLTAREKVIYTRHHSARGPLVREDAVGCFSAAIPTHTVLDDGAKAGDWVRSLATREELSSFALPPANLQSQILASATDVEFHAEKGITEDARWVRLDVKIFPAPSTHNLQVEWAASPDRPFKILSNEAYFPSARYQELLGYLEHALHSLANASNRLLWDTGILSKNEVQSILRDSSGKYAFAANTLPAIFDTTQEQFSSHPAVVIGSESLSYRELHDYASRFANSLKDQGIQKGDHVLLSLHATSWYWVALLGTLKLGAVAVPCVPAPEMKDALPFSVKAVICDSSTLAITEEIFTAEERHIIPIDRDWHAIYGKQPMESSPVVSADAMAITFLNRKDAAIEVISFSHRSFANAAHAIRERLQLRSTDRILQTWNSMHPGFYEQLFAAMHAGATMVLNDPAPASAQFSEILETAEITAIYCDTCSFEQWMREAQPRGAFSPLRVVAIRDAFPPVRTVAAWNTYASESVELVIFWSAGTLSTVCLEIFERDGVSCGRVLDNAIAYILDGPRVPPIATEGELVIGGSSLASHKSKFNAESISFERDSLASSREEWRLRSGIRARKNKEGLILAAFPRYTPPEPEKKAPAPAPKRAAVKSRQDSSETAESNEDFSLLPTIISTGEGVQWLRTGEGKALFVMHPAKGGVEIYASLLHYLPSDIPIAVLTPGLLQNGDEMFVETLAKRYLETLEQLQTSGGWHIAGYGNGTWIAWEMAQILAMHNREFATIAMIDASPPRTAGIKGLWQTGLSFGRPKAVNHLVPTEDSQWSSTYRAFEGPAKIHILSQPGSGMRGWQAICPAAMLHEVRASGNGLLEEPRVRLVADFLSNRLRRSRAKI